MKSMQGLEGNKSVAFKDLCVLTNFHLPPGFKNPKFDKYDGYDDPIAHLKRYCNQLRGVGIKEELFMAYYGESRTSVSSKLLIDLQITHQYIWDDMAQDFFRQFEYNVDIMPDHNTLSNMRKKSSESFGGYAIKWREQEACVKPPLNE